MNINFEDDLGTDSEEEEEEEISDVGTVNPKLAGCASAIM